MAENTASALFGVEGLRVFDADVEAGGTVTVWALTDHPGAASCPDCGAVSGRVHEYVLTRPRDLRRGLGEIMVAWGKRRWKCVTRECARKTFTESLPAIPPRCRLTSRLRDLLATEVAERGRTVAEAGRMLPAARRVVDLFHVVQLAVKVTGDVRRRVVREKYGRRGRSGDPEYTVKSLPVRNLEHLSPAQFAKVMDTLGGDRDGR